MPKLYLKYAHAGERKINRPEYRKGDSMRNAKKLLLLLLSLVLLIGVFTVAALAEETTEAQTATVVYPDGTTQTVNVGDTIVEKEFENGFYQGAGNTLFKDDATAGWTFTLEGEMNALTDLTVTEAMSGKVILAGGADKVYATVEITITAGDYVIWLGNKQYVVAGTTAVSDGTTLETAARKIPVGTHTLYFTKAGELARFLTGSIGIVLAIPVAAFVAIYWYTGKQDRKAVGSC